MGGSVETSRNLLTYRMGAISPGRVRARGRRIGHEAVDSVRSGPKLLVSLCRWLLKV